MASNQLVQTRIDGAIKEEAASVLAAFQAPLIPNATTIQAMKDARAGQVTKAANLDALFVDLNADT